MTLVCDPGGLPVTVCRGPGRGCRPPCPAAPPPVDERAGNPVCARDGHQYPSDPGQDWCSRCGSRLG